MAGLTREGCNTMKIAALVTLILLLGIAVVLAGTNPTTQQYQAFLESSLTRALERNGEDNLQETSREKQMLRELIRSQGKKVIQSVTRSNTIRHNYGLFSIFETTALGVRVQVIGVGTQFVPLEDEQEIVKKLGQLIL
jgi:hypothetical protein